MINDSFSRRRFLQGGSAALAAVAVPGQLSFKTQGESDLFETLLGTKTGAAAPKTVAELKALSQIGLDAAKKNGAMYADVVFTHQRREEWEDVRSSRQHPIPYQMVTASAGVRVLYKGYWGFAGLEGAMTPDTMVRLGTDAAMQAKYAARGTPRTVDLAPTPVITDGEWTMPVEIDPFTVSIDEKIDYLLAICDAVERERVGGDVNVIGMGFLKEHRTFASTEGSFTSQTSYQTNGYFAVRMEEHYRSHQPGGHAVSCIDAAGAGWEYLLRAPIRDRIAQTLEHAARGRYGKPIEIGRFDVVFDAQSMAAMLASTVRYATELDRAMGYIANNEGTSFLNDPLDMLGKYQLGSPLVNISANRSMREGASTMRWDDDGVEPRETTLVKDGILHDYQTTRETASWLAPYYRKAGMPVQSGGCAGRNRASSPTTHRAPNLVLAPGPDNTTFADMIANTKRGYAVIDNYYNSDFQILNGYGQGLMYEIRDGKLGESVSRGGYLYRVPEFWKNVVALGGSDTAENVGRSYGRNESYSASSEMYRAYSTVRAVPAKVKNVTMIDPRRRF